MHEQYNKRQLLMTTKITRALFHIALVVLMFNTVVAKANQAQQKAVPQFGGTIRVAINSDIRSTNPGVLRDGNTDTVLYHVVESLVAYTEQLTVAPMLAEKINISEDRKTYTFTLRKDVVFHNGEIMRAEHVVWSWQRMLAEETGFRCREFYDGRGATGLKIVNIEALDPNTVVFELNQPSALFLHRMANIQCLTAILHPDSVDAMGEWVNPVGTGPYQFSQWRRGQDITLKKFPRYSAREEPRNGLTGKKVAYVEQIVFVITPDRIAAKAALYAGNMDLVFAVPLSSVRELERRKAQRGDIDIYQHATLDWTVLLMQSNDPLLSNVKMRRAIAHAISPSLITEVSTFGIADPNSSAVQSINKHHSAVHDKWLEYDPEKARQLAIESGYKGEQITIQTNKKFSYMFDNAVAIQAMLTAAGFNIKITVSDWSTQLSHFINGNFQLSSFGYSARSHPALLYGNFTGSKSVRNSFQWQSIEAQQLIAKLEVAFDDSEAQRILDQLHQLMIEDVPLVGLYNDRVIDVTKRNIHGYSPWAFGRPRLWGVWLTEEQ
jgi:peptide/nickel transport system substrate-binding protein